MPDDTEDYRPPPSDDDPRRQGKPALIVAFQMLPGFGRPFALELAPTLGRMDIAAASTGVAGAAEDPTVSRTHLRLERSRGGDGIVALRCESARGVTINGWPVQANEPVSLLGGEIVRMGGTVLAYHRTLLPRVEGGSFLLPDGDLQVERALVVAPYGLRALRWDLHHLHERARRGWLPRGVLVQGETGTGKEHVARAVARALGRSGVEVKNVAAIPRDLLAAELFGVRKGAFTGAETRLGAIREAQRAGRALFLDEIGDLSLEAQAAMLRFLQSGEVQPVGGSSSASTPSAADVPVVFATHRDLEAMVRAGSFREDLLARIQERLIVPPLRERRYDALALLRALWGAGAEGADRLPAEAVERLLLARHTENIRGLERLLNELARRSTQRLSLDEDTVGRVLRVDQHEGNRAALCPSAVRTAFERGSTKKGTRASYEAAHRWLAERHEGPWFSEGTFTRYAKSLGL